jgi:acetyl esterase/lipase
MTEVVRFRSEGLECVGDLLTPESAREPAPAIILGRGFGGVREGNRREAAFFQAAGFVVLSIDYRFFGDSAGEPRGRLHPLEQVEDFRSAMTSLERRPEVDAQRIGLWGTSFAGGVVLYTAAVDRRVRAVVAHLPIVHGGRWLRSLRSAGEWEELLILLEDDRRRRFSGEPGARIKLSGQAKLGERAVIPGDAEQAEHFVNLKRTQATWRDDITLESLEHVIDFRPIDVVGAIAPRATCIVTAAGYDPVHPLDQILEAYERCREPRQLHLIGQRGLDLRFDPGWTRCLELSADWFATRLSPDVPRRSA